MKLFILGFATLLATGSAFAGTSDTSAVIHDRTGFFVHLDVAKVLSMTDISDQCDVIPARLDYLDHQGREHVLDYQVQGRCTNEN
jgi:prophage antirepressor-like protein